MSKAEQKRPGEPGERPGGRQEQGVEQAFDLWLQRGLHQLYDNVANEPIPDALLKLIEEDRAARERAAKE
ncbi:NepR family anti-sigma factor [Siccirubricoccus phaeus]|uniref:NepR family anti-sigma factor n=1 Tax=Siccirubricoccus phaeus TaxID=2595053 RepID=UPI0011F0A88F